MLIFLQKMYNRWINPNVNDRLLTSYNSNPFFQVFNYVGLEILIRTIYPLYKVKKGQEAKFHPLMLRGFEIFAQIIRPKICHSGLLWPHFYDLNS